MKKILIIEDDTSLAENLNTLLSNRGYESILASNGFDGYEKVKELLPDLIICDVMMPGMDGYEVKKKLNLNLKLADIPIIYLTAKSEISDLRQGMSLGADDYIFKPYDAKDLLNAVEIRINKSERIKAKIKKEKSGKKTKYDISDKIFLTINNKPKFIKIANIVYIQAESQYVNLFIYPKITYLIRKPLTHWEAILPDNVFFRIHRSTIINTEYIVKIENWFNNSYRIHLKDLTEPFVLSRRYAKQLKFKM